MSSRRDGLEEIYKGSYSNNWCRSSSTASSHIQFFPPTQGILQWVCKLLIKCLYTLLTWWKHWPYSRPSRGATQSVYIDIGMCSKSPHFSPHPFFNVTLAIVLRDRRLWCMFLLPHVPFSKSWPRNRTEVSRTLTWYNYISPIYLQNINRKDLITPTGGYISRDPNSLSMKQAGTTTVFLALPPWTVD